MERADRWSIEPEQTPALEHAIDDRVCEVLVVQDAPPALQRLVRRKDHRPVAAMPLVDDVEEHVGDIGAVCEHSARASTPAVAMR